MNALKSAEARVDLFLARCNPAPLPPEETLRRLVMQMDALHNIAVTAAEEKMPGWSDAVLRLEAKIAALRAAGSGI